MIIEPAAYTVRIPAPYVAQVLLTGELTAASEESLMAAFGSASAAGARTVILDFSQLEYMNSSGIGVLVTLLVRASRQRQRVLACGMSDHYRQILELTRLDEAIGLYDSEIEAIRAARAGTEPSPAA